MRISRACTPEALRSLLALMHQLMHTYLVDQCAKMDLVCASVIMIPVGCPTLIRLRSDPPEGCDCSNWIRVFPHGAIPLWRE